MKRTIRRTALLNIQKVSYSRDHVAQVRSEGFTDIGVSLKTGERKFTGQGFDWEQVGHFGAWAQEFGLGMTVFTGYMKYRETFLRDHPERAMVCVGGSGTALDSDNLVRTKWLCPFQPENKADYLDLLRKVIGLPALREIHLNDEAAIGFANGDIGCYCDHCVSEYEREYGSPPPADFDWESDAWWAWVQRRMARWTEVHAWFREQIRKERPDVLVGIQYSPVVVSFNDNIWRAGIDLSQDALAQDVLCTDPYHYNHTSHFTYRPARRILTEATRTLAGATVGRSMNIYPQAFRPPLGGPELTRRDGFMAGAVPYALGADNITPYSNDLARILPGFLDGFHEAGKLIPYFEKTKPCASATVINPTQTEIRAYGKSGNRLGPEGAGGLARRDEPRGPAVALALRRSPRGCMGGAGRAGDPAGYPLPDPRSEGRTAGPCRIGQRPALGGADPEPGLAGQRAVSTAGGEIHRQCGNAPSKTGPSSPGGHFAPRHAAVRVFATRNRRGDGGRDRREAGAGRERG